MLNFIKYFFCICWDDLVVLPFLLLMWYITLFYLHMLNYPCDPGMIQLGCGVWCFLCIVGFSFPIFCWECLHLYSSKILAYNFGRVVLSLEKAMAPHSSTLAWKVPWMQEPGGLQSMVSLRVGHNWATSLSLFSFMHWRRKWQPTPVFSPGESQGRQSLVDCCQWGRTESDTTEAT